MDTKVLDEIDAKISEMEKVGSPWFAIDINHAAELVRGARRWSHARKLLTIDDIEGAQGALDSFGSIISEEECVKADNAIDTAMGKKG